jgi:hypothetical protein
MSHSRRYESALLVLLVLMMSVAVLLAGCGSSPTTSTTTQPPSVAGMWTGRLIDYEDPARPYEAALVVLTLEQSSTGQLSGASTMCTGIFGTHVQNNSVSGAITGSSHVHLDIGFFHLDGLYSTQSYRHIALEGTFASSNAVQKAIALTVLPASFVDYASGCSQTPTTAPSS